MTGATWTWDPLKPLAYRVIYADCAWEYKTYSEKGKGRSPKYRTMTVEEIMDLRVADLAHPDGCVLIMWITDPFLDRFPEILDSWGFTYKTVAFYWVKIRLRLMPLLKDVIATVLPFDRLFHFGKGHWTRDNPEIAILATIGSPSRRSASVRKLIFAETREHSRKPDCVYERIEQLLEGPYCELFSRTSAPGWDAWGDQAGTFELEKLDGE